MLEIVLPSREDMLRVQAEQGSYYWSSAIDLMLRKQGLLPRPTRNDGSAVALVGRAAPASIALRSGPRVLEGPLSESVVQALGVEAKPQSAEWMQVEAAQGDAGGHLVYNRYLVRKIPPHRSVVSDPYEFVSSDPLWNNRRIAFQALTPDAGDQPLLYAKRENGGKRICVALRRGNLVLLGVPLFDLIVQHHACPPYEDAGYFGTLVCSEVAALEAWLTDLCIELAQDLPIKPLRLGPWPGGRTAALTVRHDFDRHLPDGHLHELLDFYAKRKFKATWFWRLNRIEEHQLRAVIDAGHEVALHTEASNREEFLTEVATLAKAAGVRLQGYSAHGGIPAIGYLGARQFEWAIDAGMRYGEKLGGSAADLPHAAVVIADGLPSAIPFILPEVHRSLDITMRPDGHVKEQLAKEGKALLARSAHCVIMNHPDIHRRELMELLDGLPHETVWKATLAEVCAWAHQWQYAKLAEDEGGLRIAFPHGLDHKLDIQTNGRSFAILAGTRALSLEGSGIVARIERDKPLVAIAKRTWRRLAEASWRLHP